MPPTTAAQLANNQKVQQRFHVQGLDDDASADSLFNLSSAPPLKKHVNAAEIFLEVQHFVPTRFEDQMKFMIMIETNRKKFLAERKRAKELMSLGLASADLRNTMFGKPKKMPETVKEKEARRQTEAKAAQDENRLFALYELHEDRKSYNKQFTTSYKRKQFHKAHHFATKYLEKCSDEQREVALRQDVIALRQMGKKIGKRNRNCEMWVEEARGNCYDVLEPKVLPDTTHWLQANVSPFQLTRNSGRSRDTAGKKNKNKNSRHQNRSGRLHKVQTVKAKRALRASRQQLALHRRVVMHSAKKI